MSISLHQPLRHACYTTLARVVSLTCQILDLLLDQLLWCLTSLRRFKRPYLTLMAVIALGWSLCQLGPIAALLIGLPLGLLFATLWGLASVLLLIVTTAVVETSLILLSRLHLHCCNAATAPARTLCCAESRTARRRDLSWQV